MKIKDCVWQCIQCDGYENEDACDPDHCDKCGAPAHEDCLDRVLTLGAELYLCEYCVKRTKHVRDAEDLLGED